MRFTFTIAALGIALTATSSVARQAPVQGMMQVSGSTVGSMPQVALPAVEALLDEGELLAGKIPDVPDIPREELIEAVEESELAALPKDDLQALVKHFAGTQPRNPQMDCLAKAIYFETRGEPLHGQLAVGEVILNRSESRKFPNSYCGVVKQRRQFSFVRNGRIPKPRYGSKAWRTAVAVARIVHAGHHQTNLNGALFFHANYVSPRWRLKRMGSIGNHIFYR